MKKVLGLDLGTTSIGWALVNEAESKEEKSSIIQLGVRVIPLTVDEQQNFEKGKSITTNADRTLKRCMRRNLQRYKLRREALIEILKASGFISDETILSENGNRTTFETYRLRARAVTEEISLEELARVLLMINKKRGYKSSRKAKNQDEGQLLDGMEIAKRLYDENITPGQLCLQLLRAGKKYLPDFYRSDLQNEFDRVWAKQAEFYPDILTDELKDELRGKKRDAVYAICVKHFVWKEKHIEWSNEEARKVEVEKECGIVGKRNGNANEQRIENIEWRVKGLDERLHLEELVVVLQEINTRIDNSSGYLGFISDRSKELYFNRQTVGQYQMAILAANPHASLRNMVFYRQDYLDEFNAIWDTQAKFHSELTNELKQEVRDVVIFYQRRLKSQKGLVGFCEFESRKIEVEIEGKIKTKTVGSKVIPRSSPLFQEFKIWQTLNNLVVWSKGVKSKRRKKENGSAVLPDRLDTTAFSGERKLEQEEKEILARELSVKEKMLKAEILKLLFDNPQAFDLNVKEIQGNVTQAKLIQAYLKIIEQSGHEIDPKQSAVDILKNIEEIFGVLGYKTDMLYFDSGKPLDEQPMYRLWHLLYSFEGDNSNVGNEKLLRRLAQLFGFEKESAVILANVVFPDDYGSLSAKAICKILPYLKDGHTYDIACEYAGYRHSKSSLTKDEIANKVYKDRLEILPKNTLRNPVVEKILNQMVNVINTIIDVYGKPDEIRIELARELKKNAEERKELTESIAKSTKAHEEYRKILSKPVSEGGQFGLTYVSRNDIIRYKLWKELEKNKYCTLYSNTYISPTKLFSGDFDIEHIIPQSRLFDDSFSNKTLELRSVNLEKGNRTAYDYVKNKYGDSGKENSLDSFLDRIEALCKQGALSKTKYRHLSWQESEIPEGFINRELGDTRYIAKYAKTMLCDLVPKVVSTTGTITNVLREDWQLVDVMQELNWEKYDKLGLTYYEENREGKQLRRIKDWSKRNDHRHHAMDALTVAFTKEKFVQLFNNLNASQVSGTEESMWKQLYLENGRVKPPILPLSEFRSEAKRYLENTLVSIKAKNKVVTHNINTTKKVGGTNKKVQQTPRGQLHNETIYGSRMQYMVKYEKIGTAFDEAKIRTVTKPSYRDALLNRLRQYGDDPKKAFAGKNTPVKNPIFINDAKTEQLPEKVKTVTYETVYTIRKKITPDLKIEKVVDTGVREVLKARLADYGNDAKKAFSNLDENPIWINREKGISIKRVTISGISNAESLHDKRDKDGNLVLDGNGNKQPVDFVSTSNNHHVAIYRDAEGNLQEKVVSFFEAVTRKNLGQPVIDKEYKKAEGWEFLFSMKQNEYFVFLNEQTGFNPKEINLLDPANYTLISPNLFRVQKFASLSSSGFWFRHHLETNVDAPKELKGVTYQVIRSASNINGIVKVRINHIGQIIWVGEY